MTHPGIKADDSPEDEVAFPETGDTYDEDLGTYLGTLNFGIDGTKGLLPAQISIYYGGYWYIFKPQSRYKDVEDEESKKIVSEEKLSPLELLKLAGEIKP